MAMPDYLVCLNCETPCYEFEWKEGEIKEAQCLVCGNEDPVDFMAPDELAELTGE